MIRPGPKTQGEQADREHLLRVLSELLERTFASEGQAATLRLMADLLRRLDGSTLRELAYQQGLTTEFDLEPEENEK